jgi:hypothetical protein
LPQKSDLAFTPGFSPVMTGQKVEEPFQRFSFSEVTEAFQCERVTPLAEGKTVETVALRLAGP